MSSVSMTPAPITPLATSRSRVCGVLLAEHRRLRTGEQDVEVGLVLRADREPAEAVHGRVAAHLEAELLRVERLGAVLVFDEHVHVRELLDHGPDATAAPVVGASSGLLTFCARPRPRPHRGRSSPGSGGAPADGDSGTRSVTCRRGRVKRELKEPTLSKPTRKQISVMVRLAARSRSLARSIRRRVRYVLGVLAVRLGERPREVELGQVRRLRHRVQGEGLGEVAVGEVARPPQRDQDLGMAEEWHIQNVACKRSSAPASPNVTNCACVRPPTG